MSNAIPSRAAAALSPGFPLALANGKTLLLGPFTLRRRLMLENVASPLFSNEEHCGIVFGWCATLRIFAEPDPVELTHELAAVGPAGFVAESVEWFCNWPGGFAVEDLAAAALAIKAEWSRLCDLDKPDAPTEEGRSKMGESCGPGTDSSPNSSATPSPPGTGGPTKPSTAPLAS
ncbi:MAG: hypothetical protein IJ678_04415 [Kiritimatiellae bacterium]|nr:hypothetical protein [Kiritimatiellia bacterium]